MSGTATATRAQNSPWLARGLTFGILALVLMLVYFASARNRGELSTKYGQRRGSGAVDSVNGTAVLAELFEQAGHRVTTATQLSNRLDNCSTIVWTPDSFGPPSEEARQFLDKWLAASSGRTLVYIGRDYDAASDYWQHMLAQADDDQHNEYLRRLAHAQSEFATQRSEFPEQKPCEWFTMESGHPTRRIPDLDGPWAEGVDASQTDIVLAGRLDIPEPGEFVGNALNVPLATETDNQVQILLQSENDILAHRFQQGQWSSSKVIVVANGSFTLNMGLVNKEHRKLAAKLVAECGPAARMAFLESGPQGVYVDKGVKQDQGNHALRIFGVWPVSFIFIHFAALGIAYCIAAFPVFGRPQTLPGENRSDFGQHIAALGELLRKTKDASFAESRIRQYQTHAKRTSGQSHRPAAAAPLTATIVETVEINPVASNRDQPR
jgi:hypothetical protein